MARRSPLFQNLLLALFTVLVVGGGAEGLARWLEPPRLAIPPANDITRWADGEVTFYTIKSSATGWPPWEDYNSEGVRDREHAVAKPPGVRRVVCLGDSVTLGTGLDAQDAYPQLLQDRLDAEGQPVEVLNVALGGWSTVQEHVAYTHIARKYRPDLVLLGVCLNDLPELQNNLARPPGLLRALYGSSALVRWAMGARGREIRSIDELFLSPHPPRVRAAFDRFFAEVDALDRDVRADGARLALVVLPYRGQMAPGGPPPSVQEEIAAFGARRRLPVLDLRPALADLGASAFTDHVHLTADATRRVADAIADSGFAAPAACEGCPSAPRLPPAALAGPARDQTALLAALGDRDEGRRAAAARALGNSEHDPAAVVPALAALLRDASPRVRAAAAWALGHFPAAEPREMAPLFRVLDDEDAVVRAGAAWSVGKAGPAAGMEAARLLVARLGDAEPNVRRRAGDALVEVGARCATCLRDVIAIAATRDHPARAAAAEALGGLGTEAQAAVPVLTDARRDPRPDVRGKAIWALGRVGPAARDAVPGLTALVDDPSFAWSAIDALGAIGPGAESAVPRLVQALREPSGSVRWRAVQALGRMGPAAGAAAPALLAALDDAEGNVRLAAVDAAGRVEGEPSALAAALGRLVHDDDARVRAAVAHGLGRVGASARAQWPHLVEATRDHDPGVRLAAARALVRVGASAEARPLLASLSEHDEDAGVRAEAHRLLQPHARAASTHTDADTGAR